MHAYNPLVSLARRWRPALQSVLPKTKRPGSSAGSEPALAQDTHDSRSEDDLAPAVMNSELPWYGRDRSVRQGPDLDVLGLGHADQGPVCRGE